MHNQERFSSLQVWRRAHWALAIILMAGLCLPQPAPWVQAQSKPAAGEWHVAASLMTARGHHTATLLPNGQVLLAGGFDSVGFTFLANAEVYDPVDFSIAQVSMSDARSHHTATLLPGGQVLVAGGWNGNDSLSGVEMYDSENRIWGRLASMNTARHNHTATLLPGGKVLVAGGWLVSSAELYDPFSDIWTLLPPMQAARGSHTATLLPDGKVLVAGGRNSGGFLAGAELFDPPSGIWTAVAPMHTARASHTATLLPETGQVLVVGGQDANFNDLASAEVYDSQSGTWTEVESMKSAQSEHSATLLPNGDLLVLGRSGTQAEIYDPSGPAGPGWYDGGAPNLMRSGHTATLLPDGRVLLAGGENAAGFLNSVELYDGLRDSGAILGVGALNTGRYSHTATLLADGRVLVAGGRVHSLGEPLASAEIYDPATLTWMAAASMQNVHYCHTATLLSDGRVLVTGGWPDNRAELYDPLANTWTSAAPMHAKRCYHRAVLLSDAKVLVMGGQSLDDPDGYLDSAEVYDPQANTWINVGSMHDQRCYHTATLLPNGRVLVTGGDDPNGTLGSAELYDPDSQAWTVVAPMHAHHNGHSATLLLQTHGLRSSKVLVVGGGGATVELYDPADDVWSVMAPLHTARLDHTATLLPDGRVLVTGGKNDTTWLGSVEIYDPSFDTWTQLTSFPTSRTQHTATLLPDGLVLVTGGENNGSALAETSQYIWGNWFLYTWRPRLDGPVLPLKNGHQVVLRGDGWNGRLNSQASSGSVNSSDTNVPLVRVQRIDNEQVTWLPPASFSRTTYTSLPIYGLAYGPAMLTVYVNGIPSLGRVTTTRLSIYLPVIRK